MVLIRAHPVYYQMTARWLIGLMVEADYPLAVKFLQGTPTYIPNISVSSSWEWQGFEPCPVSEVNYFASDSLKRRWWLLNVLRTYVPIRPLQSTSLRVTLSALSLLFSVHFTLHFTTFKCNVISDCLIGPMFNLSDLPIPDPGSWIQTQAHYHNATLTIHENHKWNEINMLALKLSLLLTTLSSQIFKICFSTIAKQAFV